MTDQSAVKSTSAAAQSSHGLFNVPVAALPEYLVDAAQRSVLFLDLLRQRGNQQLDTSARPMTTVLRFEHEVLLDGKLLPRPINYSLSRIVPPIGLVIDPCKRPVVVVDPRAGQASGIGGFKSDSEIGDALSAGHTVYFIGFSALPEPGQQFLDVVEGQVTFFERVVELHPDAPLPFAIGNCQAGYQTLMVAMLRPDLFGPCLIPGSPMSYWQGERGKNPMRYSGGLLGGSWLNEMTSDLGKGKVDGTGLVLNFDNLNPAYWLWGKQYEVYANIDTGGERYLEFEKWWGDFIELNGEELQFLVDNLFIGDKLTRNQLHSSDGTVFDLRNITSPIIVFTSSEDNISPPPQSLGWIADLYLDVDDIRATGRTIIYCMSHKVGHLAIFVSSKVGKKQDEEFVQLMDVIDCLPPGLYEMVVTARPAGSVAVDFATGEWQARFEGRTMEDIRAVGRNSLQDDRAFAAVAKLSEINLSLYRNWMQPTVRAFTSQSIADLTHMLNPLRLSYTIFADSNPLMNGVQQMAAEVATVRKPMASDNPFLVLQENMSDRINASLDNFKASRDQQAEKAFFGFYGSPLIQAMLGISSDGEVRPPPYARSEQQVARLVCDAGDAEKVMAGGFNEAMVRAVLYVFEADRSLDQRSAFALNTARQSLMHLSLSEFKALVREQFSVLQRDRENAVLAIPVMVQVPTLRKELLKQVHAIVDVGDPLSMKARAFLDQLGVMLATLKVKEAAARKSTPTTASAKANVATATRRHKV